MDVKVFAVLFWACATWQISVNANEGCIYEGKQLKKGPFPFETHPNTDTEEKCKDICDSDPLCVIWQWQPKQKKCWIIYPDFKRDANSDFGINNCKDGKPTENAPKCKVEKGNREHKLKNHWRITKEDCIAKCSDDSDCLIWQYFKKERLCQIHKLKVDTSKKSQVGIHYCSSSSCSTCTACGHDGNNTSRILGGAPPLYPNDFDFQVMLTVNGEFQCGGTILSELDILTSAHCVFNWPLDSIRVLLGVKRECEVPNAPSFGVSDVKVYPGYNPSFSIIESDVAVLTLSQPIQEYTGPKPSQAIMCLPLLKDDFYGIRFEDQQAFTIGYGGVTDPSVPGYPTNLLGTTLVTMSNTKCISSFGEIGFFPNNPIFPYPDHICAEAIQTGTCVGDSGSPLMLRNVHSYYYQIGITTTGSCNNFQEQTFGNVVSIFTRTSIYLKFIRNAMKGTRTCDETFQG